MMWHEGWQIGWYGWMFMAAWWVLLVAGIVWLVRQLVGDRSASSSSNARRILDERFASGELGAEEYEERRRLLR